MLPLCVWPDVPCRRSEISERLSPSLRRPHPAGVLGTIVSGQGVSRTVVKKLGLRANQKIYKSGIGIRLVVNICV